MMQLKALIAQIRLNPKIITIKFSLHCTNVFIHKTKYKLKMRDWTCNGLDNDGMTMVTGWNYAGLKNDKVMFIILYIHVYTTCRNKAKLMQQEGSKTYVGIGWLRKQYPTTRQRGTSLQPGVRLPKFLKPDTSLNLSSSSIQCIHRTPIVQPHHRVKQLL